MTDPVTLIGPESAAIGALTGTRFAPTLTGGPAPADYAPNVARYLYGWRAGSLYRVNAVCPDGKVRRATVTADADTAWTVPARVTAGGRTVSGFITADDEPAADNVTADPYGSWRPVYRFHVRQNGRNAAAIVADR